MAISLNHWQLCQYLSNMSYPRECKNSLQYLDQGFYLWASAILLFSLQIAPYASVIVNGVYWAPKNPRLLTFDDALMLLEVKQKQDKYGGCPELPHRLLAICDISADLGVSAVAATLAQ